MSQDVFWRNANFSRNVRTNLAHNEIRLGECEQQSMRLNVTDDLDLLLGTPVVVGKRLIALDRKRVRI